MAVHVMLTLVLFPGGPRGPLLPGSPVSPEEPGRPRRPRGPCSPAGPGGPKITVLVFWNNVTVGTLELLCIASIAAVSNVIGFALLR